MDRAHEDRQPERGLIEFRHKPPMGNTRTVAQLSTPSSRGGMLCTLYFPFSPPSSRRYGVTELGYIKQVRSVPRSLNGLVLADLCIGG